MEDYKTKWEQKIGTTLSPSEINHIFNLMGNGNDERYDTKEHLKKLIDSQIPYIGSVPGNRQFTVLSLQNKLTGGRRRFRSTHSIKYKKMAKHYSRAVRRKCKNRK
jgi:hypothetical protein